MLESLKAFPVIPRRHVTTPLRNTQQINSGAEILRLSARVLAARQAPQILR